MKKKIIGMFVVMLFITTTALPVLGEINDEDTDTKKKIIKIEDNVEPLIHPQLAYLFGTVENKHSNNFGWYCEAVNLRVFNFEELEHSHYTNSHVIEISRFGLGIFTNRFIWGFYTIM